MTAANNNKEPRGLGLFEGHKKRIPDISTNLEELEYYEDCIQTGDDYLIDTFVDPFDLLAFRAAVGERRNKLADKQFMGFLVETPVTQIDPRTIDDHIHQIHLESPQFNPGFLFDHYHPNLPLKDLQLYHRAIPTHMGRNADQLLVQYFFEGLV